MTAADDSEASQAGLGFYGEDDGGDEGEGTGYQGDGQYVEGQGIGGMVMLWVPDALRWGEWIVARVQMGD